MPNLSSYRVGLASKLDMTCEYPQCTDRKYRSHSLTYCRRHYEEQMAKNKAIIQANKIREMSKDMREVKKQKRRQYQNGWLS